MGIFNWGNSSNSAMEKSTDQAGTPENTTPVESPLQQANAPTTSVQLATDVLKKMVNKEHSLWNGVSAEELDTVSLAARQTLLFMENAEALLTPSGEQAVVELMHNIVEFGSFEQATDESRPQTLAWHIDHGSLTNSKAVVS